MRILPSHLALPLTSLSIRALHLHKTLKPGSPYTLVSAKLRPITPIMEEEPNNINSWGQQDPYV